MWGYVLASFSLSLVVATSCMAQQERRYVTEAGIDSDGSIYVSSDGGQHMRMATREHCIEARVAEDRQTVGCSVARGTKPEEAMQSTRLEIYLRNGKLEIIETKTPMDWHFWREGQQVSVSSHSLDGKDLYTLYEAATARPVEELVGPSDKTLLPEWAKSPAQVQDESVPVDNDFNQERTMWIAKALRQMKMIEPGMRRQDLLKVFTTEGGLSTRSQRTYVYSECQYIKVNVRFKPANSEENNMEEKPDDVIDSISQPYLEFSVTD